MSNVFTVTFQKTDPHLLNTSVFSGGGFPLFFSKLFSGEKNDNNFGLYFKTNKECKEKFTQN